MGLNTDCRTGPFNWIDGHRQEPVDAAGAFDNIEPRTGKTLSKVTSSGQKEVDRAVQSAKKAFEGWRKVGSVPCANLRVD